METVTEKKYICEYCRAVYSSMIAALDCLASCKLRAAERLKWYEEHKPKYKVGDFVYTLHMSFPYRVVGYLRCMGKVNPSYCYKIVAGKYEEPFLKHLEDLKICMRKHIFLKCCDKILKGLPLGSLYTIWPAARRKMLSTQDHVLNVRLYMSLK